MVDDSDGTVDHLRECLTGECACTFRAGRARWAECNPLSLLMWLVLLGSFGRASGVRDRLG